MQSHEKFSQYFVEISSFKFPKPVIKISKISHHYLEEKS